MMKREPHFKTAEVIKNRARFLAEHNEDAAAVLKAVNDEICKNPEDGTETSKKGTFCRSLLVRAPQSQALFLCEISYTFTYKQVGWEGFSGEKVVKKSTKPSR